MSVVLRPMSRSAADALLARRTPTDVEVAADHPTEFSAGIAEAVGGGSPLDRPASGRVLERAGFALMGEAVDEHDGAAMRVRRWELAL